MREVNSDERVEQSIGFRKESVAVDGFGRGACAGRLSETAGLTLGLEQAEDVVLTDWRTC